MEIRNKINNFVGIGVYFYNDYKIPNRNDCISTLVEQQEKGNYEMQPNEVSLQQVVINGLD